MATFCNSIVPSASFPRQFPKKDGVLSFVENDYYYGKLPQQEMPILLDVYQNEGVAALKAYLNTHKPRGRRVLLNSFRANHADGRFLLPLDPTSVVFDLGWVLAP